MKKKRTPSARKPPLTGVVHSLARPFAVHIKNDVGGSSNLPHGDYRVRVRKTWYDDEIGRQYIGSLIDPRDIEIANKEGTSGFKPRDYREFGQKRYRKVLKAARSFDPRTVYFSEFEFTPDRHRRHSHLPHSRNASRQKKRAS